MLTSSEQAQEIAFEMVEDFSIMDVSQKGEEYITTVQAIVKNLGEDASNQFNFDLSFYDENGNMLGTESATWCYIGQGEAMVIQQQHHLSYQPASVKAENLVMYAGHLSSDVSEGEFDCTFHEEDGKYHATVSGKIEKTLTHLQKDIRKCQVYVVFYGADGYTYFEDASMGVEYMKTDHYVVEWIGDVEIVNYKLLK